MNIKAISRNVGYALLVSALFMFFSIIVSVMNGNDSALAALIISFTITFTVGIFPFIFVRKTSELTLKSGYMIVVLSWLLSFIFGMLPYVLWGGPFTVVNAWFESVSGFTTTGSSILDNVEVLPNSLLFWRSSTHFIGGLGVVVFLLLLIPNASPIRMRLTNLELSSLSREGYNVRANKTVYIFAYVYIALAVLAFISYMLAGMTPFDAICHAFSVCATGGFSTREFSIAAFDSRLIEGLTMIFMFLGSLHFGLIYIAVVTASIKPLCNSITKFYVGALVVSTLFVATTLQLNGGASTPFGRTIWNSAFHTLSIASTSGFAVADNSVWPISSNMVLVVMGVMCGCAGSTCGGLKCDRVLVFFKAIARHINKILHPSTVHEIKISGNVLKNEELGPQLLYINLYFITLIASVTVALLCGMDSQTAWGACISSLGNVGASINELGTFGSYASIPSAAKILFTIDMFLGRIEIFPILAVIAMAFSSKKK